MSIPVELDALAAALGDFGAGYLVTVGEDGRVKVVTVEPTAAGDVVSVGRPGTGTRRNLAANPAATLVMPPREARGHTLLVDGSGEVVGEEVRLRPSAAVLHRPASHADGPPAPGGCGHDCAPVGRTEAGA